MATSTRPRFYIPALDGVRGIAFLLVFAAHAGLEHYLPGGLGVTVFFFLSGYLIATLLRLEQEQTGGIALLAFFRRRALRILPPLYLVMAIVFGLSVVGAMRIIPELSAYPAALAFYMDYYAMLPHGTEMAGAGAESLWSLGIEEHFYLVFPAFYMWSTARGMKRERQVQIFVLGCFGALLWRCVLVFGLHFNVGPGLKWTYTTTDCRFDSILWGVILAFRNNPWFEDRKNGFLSRFTGLFAVFGCLGIVISVVWRNPEFRETARYTMQGLGLYPIFYYLVAERGSWVNRVLEMRVLRWVGGLSYTLYLCHLYILREFSIRHREQRFGDALLSLGIAFGFAFLMNLLVEGPIRRVERGEMYGKRGQRSVS